MGVNRFQKADEAPPSDILRVDESIRVNQSKALQKLRAERNNEAVQKILESIRTAATDPNAPLMPLFVEAVEAHATLGEICDTLRGVFGEYIPGNWV